MVILKPLLLQPAVRIQDDIPIAQSLHDQTPEQHERARARLEVRGVDVHRHRHRILEAVLAFEGWNPGLGVWVLLAAGLIVARGRTGCRQGWVGYLQMPLWRERGAGPVDGGAAGPGDDCESCEGV